MVRLGVAMLFFGGVQSVVGKKGDLQDGYDEGEGLDEVAAPH